MRWGLSVKKILVALGGLAAVAVLAGCAVSAAGTAAMQPAAVATSTPESSSSPTPTTTTTPPPPVTTTPPTSSAPKTTKAQTTTQAPKPDVPCAATVNVCVDLSAKKAWLLEDGKVIYGPVPMLGGTKQNPTPVGTFRVSSKVKNYHSKEFDAPMPNSVFFQPGIAFHTGSLSVYSHGCIHLSSTASLKFFNTLQMGDAVQVVR